MILRFLFDEHMPPAYAAQLLRANPEITVREIGAPGAPPRGTLDPQLLIWCEEHDFLLLTNNRKSMPGHLRDHLAAGRHVPGILTINMGASIGLVVADLLFIAEAADADEYRDIIDYVPLQARR